MVDYSKQHYVPRFYLKYFSGDGRSIHCYDKLEDKLFCAKIKVIAQENWFYSVDETHKAEVENALGRVEQEFFVRPYHKLIALKNYSKLSHRSKLDFLRFMSLQMLRTKQFRSEIKDIYEQLLRQHFTEEDSKIFHLDLLTESKHIDEIAKHLFHRSWLIVENNTDKPLWTSDNPVSLHNSFGGEGNLGIWSPGVEIRFPLTQQLLLFSYDPETHCPTNNRDKMKDADVVNANGLQTKCSARYVFSPVQNFSACR